MNKNFLALIVLVGLGVAGWMNQEKLKAVYREKTGQVAEGVPVDSEGKPIDLTPVPALEGREAALKAYPALGINGSPFNKKFVALHAEAEKSEPELLTHPDWPVKLAERTAIALGGAPMPVATPAAQPPPSSGMMGSLLDKKPAEPTGKHK